MVNLHTRRINATEEEQGVATDCEPEAESSSWYGACHFQSTPGTGRKVDLVKIIVKALCLTNCARIEEAAKHIEPPRNCSQTVAGAREWAADCPGTGEVAPGPRGRIKLVQIAESHFFAQVRPCWKVGGQGTQDVPK